MNKMTKEERQIAYGAMIAMLVNPCSMAELTKKLNISPSTGYRYLRMIKGVERVGISRPVKYRVKG